MKNVLKIAVLLVAACLALGIAGCGCQRSGESGDNQTGVDTTQTEFPSDDVSDTPAQTPTTDEDSATADSSNMEQSELPAAGDTPTSPADPQSPATATINVIEAYKSISGLPSQDPTYFIARSRADLEEFYRGAGFMAPFADRSGMSKEVETGDGAVAFYDGLYGTAGYDDAWYADHELVLVAFMTNYTIDIVTLESANLDGGVLSLRFNRALPDVSGTVAACGARYYRVEVANASVDSVDCVLES